MIRISVEEVRGHLKRLGYINSFPFSDIIWVEKGIELNIPKKITEEFELTGLNNIDFISTNYYLLDPTLKKIREAEEFLTAISESNGWGDLDIIEILQKGLDKLK